MKTLAKILVALFIITTVPAIAAPVITNVYVSASTSSTATITWTTDVASTSQIRYGYDISLPFNNNRDSTLVTTHTQTLTVLDTTHLYYFAVVSVNSGGQSTQSSTYNFSLCGPPLVPMAGTSNNYYEYGTYSMTWVPPLGGTASPTVCGAPVQTSFTGSLSGSGGFSQTVADSYKVRPGPGSWRITVTDVGSLAPITINYPISAVSNDVSAELQAAAAASGLTACLANTITHGIFPADCGGGGGSGPIVEVNGTPISPASPANFVDTASVTWGFSGGTIQATASGGGGTGALVNIPVTGTIDGVNTSFTLSSVPGSQLFFFLNGQMLYSGMAYTIVGTAITMASPPLPGDALLAISTAGSISGVVNAINGSTGPFFFSGPGVNCVLTNCTFGGAPGGITTELQTNVAGTSFGGSGMFTNKTGTTPNYEFTSVPVQMNGYNSTTLVPGAATDWMGHYVQYTQDAILNNGLGGHNGMQHGYYSFEPGINWGNGFGNTQGWTVSKSDNWDYLTFTPGITQVQSGVATFAKKGDGAFLYGYCLSMGGWYDPSGEGYTCGKFNGGSISRYFFGNVANSGTGLENITVSFPGGSSNQPPVGMFITNQGVSPLLTGSLTGVTNPGTENPGHFTTSDSHAISTAWGNTATDINISSNPPNGTSASVTVSVVSGSFVNGLVQFACDQFYEPVAVTVAGSSPTQTLTGNFQSSHASGCTVYQGGPHGSLSIEADAIQNNQLTLGGPDKTGYIIVGARNANQLDYRIYEAGRQSSYRGGNVNLGISGAVTLNRTTNVVTGCGVDATRLNGIPVQISAAVDSSFNGVFTVTSINNSGCAVWSQTAANASTTGTLSAGGTVGGSSGPGAYNLYSAAVVNYIGFTTTTSPEGVKTDNFNGVVHLLPNDVTWPGEAVQVRDASTKITQLAAEGYYSMFPTNGRNVGFDAVFNGPGMSSLSFAVAEFGSTESYLKYDGSGGTGHNDGFNILSLIGPSKRTISSRAPLAGGSVFYVDANDAGITNPSFLTYDFATLKRFDGNSGWRETYDSFNNSMTLGTGSSSMQFSPVGLSNSVVFNSGGSVFAGYGGGFLVTSHVNMNLDSNPAEPCANAGVTSMYNTGAGTQYPYRVCEQFATALSYASIPLGQPNIKLAMPTSTIGANSCTAPATATLLGVTSGGSSPSTIVQTDSTTPIGISGWDPSAAAKLILTIWPSANDQISWAVCNNTVSPITGSGHSFNVGVLR